MSNESSAAKCPTCGLLGSHDERKHLNAEVAASSAATKRRRKPQRAKQLGVTDADYERMLAAQDGMCAIPACLRTPKTRRFHVDHNHETGQVRGLLCHWHNRIMPRTSDEAFAMAAYLARWEP
jgi:capsid protein